METERIELAVVEAWHEALNAGELDRLAELLADDVEFGGPRGAGRGATTVLDWARYSGIRLQPVRWYQRGGEIVVEEVATWQPSDGEAPSAPADLALRFRVGDDAVEQVVRYDRLRDALAAAGLDEAADIRPAPDPAENAPPVVESPVIVRDELPHVASSYELEGYLHGESPVSIIFFDGGPGSGPKLHRHPYAEVFIVQEGSATFTVGDATFPMTAGQIAVAPAGVPHKFVNTSDVPLRQIDIHCNDRFLTEWLEE